MAVKVKIRKGDTVEIINGADKNKRGEVIKVLADEKRLVVQGVNIRKKHQRQTQTAGGRSLNPGIIEFEASIDISNVMLVCPSCNEASRIGFHRDGDKVVRVCKSCGASIEG